jgi:hypothetical protein
MGERSDKSAPVAVGKAYDFVLWLLPKVEKFPKSHKFTVGERLSATALDVLMLLVEAAYSAKKDHLLADAIGKINSIRYLLRLARDLKLMALDSWSFAVGRLDEIGRMAGGWLKSTRPAGKPA